MDDMKRIVKDGYDKGDYPEVFHKNRELNTFEAKIFKLLESYLMKGARVLDLGCGTGIPYDIYLRDKGFKVTGVDFSAKHLKTARSQVKGVTFIQGDYTNMPFEHESYDAVIALYTIFHVPRSEQLQLFHDVYTAMKQGALALFTLGVEDNEYSEDENWAGAPSMAWSSWSVQKYKKILTDVGFNFLKAQYEGNPGDEEYHCWILCRKE